MFMYFHWIVLFGCFTVQVGVVNRSFKMFSPVVPYIIGNRYSLSTIENTIEGNWELGGLIYCILNGEIEDMESVRTVYQKKCCGSCLRGGNTLLTTAVLNAVPVGRHKVLENIFKLFDDPYTDVPFSFTSDRSKPTFSRFEAPPPLDLDLLGEPIKATIRILLEEQKEFCRNMKTAGLDSSKHEQMEYSSQEDSGEEDSDSSISSSDSCYSPFRTPSDVEDIDNCEESIPILSRHRLLDITLGKYNNDGARVWPVIPSEIEMKLLEACEEAGIHCYG